MPEVRIDQPGAKPIVQFVSDRVLFMDAPGEIFKNVCHLRHTKLN